MESIKVDLCSNCHPFYTGKQRIVDTENLVKKFEARAKSASKEEISKRKEKAIARRSRSKVSTIDTTKSVSLKDMLKSYK